jgi:putative tricarboxylic transport membrane protein
MNGRYADRISGALGMLLAAVLVVSAQRIEDSLLADPVGAAGVPTGVGVGLFLASLILFVKSWMEPAHQAVPVDESVVVEERGSAHPHAMAAGLLAILAAYVALLSLLGYVVSIGLLVGSVACLGGARSVRSVGLCMLLAGPLLWLMFDWALEIRMPPGLWPQWFAG